MQMFNRKGPMVLAGLLLLAVAGLWRPGGESVALTCVREDDGVLRLRLTNHGPGSVYYMGYPGNPTNYARQDGEVTSVVHSFVLCGNGLDYRELKPGATLEVRVRRDFFVEGGEPVPERVGIAYCRSIRDRDWMWRLPARLRTWILRLTDPTRYALADNPAYGDAGG